MIMSCSKCLGTAGYCCSYCRDECARRREHEEYLASVPEGRPIGAPSIDRRPPAVRATDEWAAQGASGRQFWDTWDNPVNAGDPPKESTPKLLARRGGLRPWIECPAAVRALARATFADGGVTLESYWWGIDATGNLTCFNPSVA